MAAKKASKKVNKTQYVKDLPKSMTAKDVVEKAKADGIKLTIAYVYSIRSKKKTGRKTSKKLGRPVGSANKKTASGGTESELHRVIERMVEEKVNQVLTARFGALLK